MHFPWNSVRGTKKEIGRLHDLDIKLPYQTGDHFMGKTDPILSHLWWITVPSIACRLATGVLSISKVDGPSILRGSKKSMSRSPRLHCTSIGLPCSTRLKLLAIWPPGRTKNITNLSGSERLEKVPTSPEDRKTLMSDYVIEIDFNNNFELVIIWWLLFRGGRGSARCHSCRPSLAVWWKSTIWYHNYCFVAALPLEFSILWLILELWLLLWLHLVFLECGFVRWLSLEFCLGLVFEEFLGWNNLLSCTD